MSKNTEGNLQRQINELDDRLARLEKLQNWFRRFIVESLWTPFSVLPMFFCIPLFMFMNDVVAASSLRLFYLLLCFLS